MDALTDELLDKRQGDMDDDTAGPVGTHFTAQKCAVNTVHVCAHDQDDCKGNFWQAYHSVKTFTLETSGILSMHDLSHWRNRKEARLISPHG